MERLFGTLQSRLPPLLRQEGLASIEAANHWLATVYIPQHNARFAVAAAEEGAAFVPFVGVLDDILCVQAERVVGNDNTVRYEGRVLQIPEQRHRRHFVKANVRVHEYPDGRLAIFRRGPVRSPCLTLSRYVLASSTSSRSTASRGTPQGAGNGRGCRCCCAWPRWGDRCRDRLHIDRCLSCRSCITI